MKFDEFTTAFIDCALWTSVDNDDNPLDSKYNIDDIAKESLELIAVDCKAFQDKAKNYIVDYAQAGHDFCLTRNGHGTGFWDRNLGETGKILTKISMRFKEYQLVIGDDNLIYFE